MKKTPIFALFHEPGTTNSPDRPVAVIQSLYIKNYALIDELDVRFHEGLNILTGQTGAGKSIIIGALNAVLGERADTETVREGTRKAVVEAIISTSSPHDSRLGELMRDRDIEWDGSEVILRREIRPSGSRAFINDTPVSISALREIGDRLVDLHGQHDHQLLLKQDHHREVVDELIGVRAAREAYSSAYGNVRKIRNELQELKRRERELEEKLELHRFQLQELEETELDEEAFQEMEAEMKRLDYAEELDQKAAMIVEAGSGGEYNLLDLLAMIEEALSDMKEREPEFESYWQELKTAHISIQELLSFTEQYKSRIEFNPGRLEEIRMRQAEVRRLEKKYGRALPELVSYRDELAESVNLAENFDLELEKKEKELKAASELLRERAEALHAARIHAGLELGNRISEALKELGIPNNRFETRVEWRYDDSGWIDIEGRKVGCHSDGPDDVVFYISTNKGESPRPLARIASGGEISRVMLAMKSVIARDHHLPVMIFDEIDTGIGGAVAEQVGKTMLDLSAHCQIIAITHQAQIAGQADHHYRVEKQEEGDRTITHIRPLDEEAHIAEVAALMSGSEVSEHAVASAREMVQKARNRRES
ncbi:DNA repair protein RecN [Balneolales bacterium ANBcel1]|nr:DNA repair protein RecN [Balneolales bacterium ANBcel1]